MNFETTFTNLIFILTPNYTLPISCYHALGNNVSNGTCCSIAICKSTGHVAADKIYCVLFDSGSSQAWIHKRIVQHNYQPIHSDDDLCIFSLVGTVTSTNLVALQKICSLEFNCNMGVIDYPVLIVYSTSLQYHIIFGIGFSDKCSFHLDYDNNLAWWMEYNISTCDITKFFHSIADLPH